MKILSLHCDYIKFKPVKKALKQPEQLTKEQEKGKEVKECLAILTTVEKTDEANPSFIVKGLVENIKDIASQVKCRKIVLYPYAHLSSELASPNEAIKILQDAEILLKKEKFDVVRAPFGYYKEFELKCKGHPLAELSREIRSTGKEKEEEGEESAAIKAAEKVKREYFILTPDGNLADAKKFDFSKHPSLKILYEYETAGSRQFTREPIHIKIMRKQELVDYEPGSDAGNFRWYPKGELIKGLMEERVNNVLQKYGALKVETPIMYDFNHPALREYLNRFPARQYTVMSDKRKFFLRFSACFGQYLMKHDMQISYKDLPLRLYELTHYSFRREQGGELAGLKRLRAFTMPDMHTLCKDWDEAKDEFLNQYRLSMQFMKDIEMQYDVLCRFEKQFYNDNKEFAKKLAKIANKPMLIELFDKRYAYFIMKFEFSVNDSIGKASTLSTVQIDVENTERFGIQYVDADGRKKYPLMLHASISGSIDRDLHAILEKEGIKAAEGKVPEFPFWLSPTQARIIPVSEKFIKEAIKIAGEFNSACIRTDVDDRALHVEKKILEAEQEWIPCIIVIGEKELKSKTLAVRNRETKKIISIKKDKIIAELKKQQADLPFKPLPLPMLLSKRPKFVG